MLANPWLDVPERPPFVLPEDKPYVDAWNLFHQDRDDLRLRVGESFPEPFLGPRDAPLVCLLLNPGWGEHDQAKALQPERIAALRRNLADDPAGHCLFYLDDEYAAMGDGWWQRKFARVKEASRVSWGELARRTLAVEYHGYHSRRFSPPWVTWPSQRFSFQLVEQAVARDAVVVTMLGAVQWERAIPGLAGKHFTTKSRQNATISKRNLDEGEFDRIVEAVRA